MENRYVRTLSSAKGKIETQKLGKSRKKIIWTPSLALGGCESQYYIPSKNASNFAPALLPKEKDALHSPTHTQTIALSMYARDRRKTYRSQCSGALNICSIVKGSWQNLNIFFLLCFHGGVCQFSLDKTIKKFLLPPFPLHTQN